MTLIDLDSIQFYQNPNESGLAGKRLSVASVSSIPIICEEGYTPTVPRPSGGWGGRLNDYDLSQVLDLTSASSKDLLDLLSYKEALDLKGTELYAGGNFRRLCF